MVDYAHRPTPFARDPDYVSVLKQHIFQWLRRPAYYYNAYSVEIKSVVYYQVADHVNISQTMCQNLKANRLIVQFFHAMRFLPDQLHNCDSTNYMGFAH